MNNIKFKLVGFLSGLVGFTWGAFGYSTLLQTNPHLLVFSSQAVLSSYSLFQQSAGSQKNQPTRVLSSVNSGYAKAQEYFAQRQRPLRHFLDIGVGATIIESIYPFELTAYPFSVYINYRREKWGQLKMPILFSLQYAPLFNRHIPQRISALAGFRYPASHDLKLFHVGFRLGVSLPTDFSFKINKPALELRLLLTHIIGPKDSAHRLYFQWGPQASLTTKQFRAGLTARIGLDNHL